MFGAVLRLLGVEETSYTEKEVQSACEATAIIESRYSKRTTDLK